MKSLLKLAEMKFFKALQQTEKKNKKLKSKKRGMKIWKLLFLFALKCKRKIEKERRKGEGGGRKKKNWESKRAHELGGYTFDCPSKHRGKYSLEGEMNESASKIEE